MEGFGKFVTDRENFAQVCYYFDILISFRRIYLIKFLLVILINILIIVCQFFSSSIRNLDESKKLAELTFNPSARCTVAELWIY